MNKIFLLFFITFTTLFAGNNLRIFSGKITSAENGEPLAGANIYIMGSTIGAATDGEGNFKIGKLSEGKYKVRISYSGYETIEKEIILGRNNVDIQIQLKETDYNLDEVVVTGTKTAKKLKNSPILTELISRKAIEKAGIVNVKDALELTMPSIEFNQDAHGANMKLHGLGNEYVLFLVDGERIAGETSGNIDFNRLNAGNIEKIEIVKGAASSLYGSNAIGGVINIISKKNKNPLDLRLNSRFSDNNEKSYSSVLGVNYGGVSSTTMFNLNSSDGYDLTPQTPTSKTQEKFEDKTISQRFEFTLSEQIKFMIKGSYYVYERFDERPIPVHPKNYSYTFGASADYFINKDVSLKAEWHSDQYKKYEVLERLDDEEKEIYDHNFNNVRLLSTYKLSSENILTAGFEYFDENLKTDRIEGGDKSASDFVFYAQDDFKYSSMLSFIAGLRVNNHSEYGTHFSPQISALYKLLPFNLRASYSRGFKAPTIKELFMDFDHFGMFFIKGNQNLKPETSNYYSLSLEYLGDFMNSSISFFRNDLDDMIATVQDIDNPNIQNYKNVANAFTQGFDLLWKMNLGYGFSLTGGYSFLDTEDKSTGLELWGTSKHSGVLRLGYSYRIKDYSLSLNLHNKMSGTKVFESKNNDGEIDKTERAGYALWKLTLSQILFKNYNITLGVDNLFDYTDNVHFTVTTPGRRYFAYININLNSNLFN